MPFQLKLSMMLPNMATLSSLALGISAITVLYEGHFTLAALLILAGAILDVLDGHLAARFDAVTEIGKQLDSLADMVTFGVAPTLLIYNLMVDVGMQPLVALLASVVFAIGGAFRLARFNTLVTDRSTYFTGMPIPMASALLIAGSFWQHWTLNFWWAVGVAIVSYLMVSNVPYPKLKHVLSASPYFTLGAAMALVSGWVLTDWQAIPFSLLFFYSLAGPLLCRLDGRMS